MSAPPITPPRPTDEGIIPLTRTAGLLSRSAPWLLRGSLAIVLVWFGALKVAGVPTMPGALIAAITPPFLDADLLVVLSGWLEVALGVGLILGRWVFPSWQPLVLAGIAAQMSLTFLIMAVRPDVAFIDGNPLALSVEGEYVLKNLVLLAAALALASQQLARRRPDDAIRRVAAGPHTDIVMHRITEPGSAFDTPRTID